ncbi:MAG: hypothetical protein WA383_04140, partial [Terriglobales bacterium]
MLAISVLWLLLLSAPQNHTASNQTSSTRNTQGPVRPPERAQESPDSGYSDNASGTQFTYNSQQESGNETAKVIFDGLLVLLTGGLVVVGIRQAQILKKQADILEKHEGWMQKHDAHLAKLAQAAMDNAKALVNSNCSLVEVFVEWVPGSSHLKIVGDKTEIFVNFICSNRGHSPASIVERIVKAEISDGFRGPDISAVNDSEIDRELIPLAKTDVNGSRKDRNYRLYASGRPGNKFILIYGVVRYRDIFTPKDKLRETWFGFYTTDQDSAAGHSPT